MRIKIAFILVLTGWIGGSTLASQTLSGSFGSVYKRYQKGEPFAGTPVLTDHPVAWQNERAYSQIVLWSANTLHDLSFETSPLIKGSDSIPASALQLLFAHNVTADRHARTCGTYPLPRIDSVEVADALSFSPLTTLSADDPVKIWVRIDVPAETPAGFYSGTIQVKQNGHARLTFKLDLEVLEKRLPDREDWNFHLDIWQYPYQLLKHYNRHHPGQPIKLWSEAHMEMLDPLYRILADAGQKVISAYLTDQVIDQPSMVKWIRKTDGSWLYDFTALDVWVEKLTAMGISRQINCFSSMGMELDSLTYYQEGKLSPEKLYMPMFSPTYYERWNHFLTAFRLHLKTRGWFDKAVLYLDEVPTQHLAKLDSLVHGHDANWKIGLSYFNTITQTESDYLYDISGNLGTTADLQREGKISTFYTSCAQTNPNSYVTPENAIAETAWFAWFTANQRLSGFLKWAYDFWTLDDPLHIQDGYFTSGENSFVYRSSNERNAEIYTSYRMEMLRKGIQDYEKIRLLQTELASSSDPVHTEARRMLDEKVDQFHLYNSTGATQLVQEGSRLLNDIVRGTYTYCPVYGSDSTNAYTQWVEVNGSSTALGNTWTETYPGGYSHYTDGKITVLPGDRFTLTVENSSSSHCARTGVWIDWNEDLDFEDDGEYVAAAGTPNSCANALSNTFAIQVPPGTKPGMKRMRIQVRDAYVEAPQPCGDVSWSTTRDFDLVVSDGYCQPLTRYNKLYFLRKAVTSGCTVPFRYIQNVMPPQGYGFDSNDTILMEKGTSFLLDLETSEMSKCARTAIWVDWNGNGNFEEAGEQIALLGEANACDNPHAYRMLFTVPENATTGTSRMRIQLRDAYQDPPQSCLVDYITGTTDFNVHITEPAGVACPPQLVSPYNGTDLPGTDTEFCWTANNHLVSKWKLKISNADADNRQPVYYEQTFGSNATSAHVSGLPGYGENLLVELSWLTNGIWQTDSTYHRAYDLYCRPMGFSDISYFVHALTSTGALSNVSYQSGDAPEQGYCRIKNNIIRVTPGSSFKLYVDESSASSCAYTKVWIDWDGNGSFLDPHEEIYASGLPGNCKNTTGHVVEIKVPATATPGTKRVRVRLCNSWLPPLEPCGGSREITTYDLDMEVSKTVQTRSAGSSGENSSRPAPEWGLKCRVYGNLLYLQGTESELSRTDRVLLYTLDGRLIKAAGKETNPIYVGDIPSGVYIVTVKKTDGGSQSAKIII